MSIRMHKRLCAFLALSCMAAPALAAQGGGQTPVQSAAVKPHYIQLAGSVGGRSCCAEYGKKCIKKDEDGKCLKEVEVCVKWQKPPCKTQK